MNNLLVSLVFQNTFAAGEEIGVSEVLLSKPLFLIGRDPRCHLVLPDPSAAPSHAAISFRDDQYRIKSTLPRLEISVNDTPIEGERSLKVGDVIRIGETELRFAEAENPVSALVTAPQAAVVKPAVQVRTSQIVARPAPRAEIAQADVPAHEPVIYFPPTMQQTQGGISPVALVGALATLVLVAGFIITMVGNLNASSARRTVPLSLVDNRDGMVRLMMFDADW